MNKEEIKKSIPKKLEKLIKDQFQVWQDYFDEFLDYKRWNDKYILEKRSTKKVHVRSIFSILQNLYSIFVIDERKVSFVSNEYEWENITRLYNKLAEYDYQKMNKIAFDFLKVYYAFIYWIGATRIATWDEETNTPVLESVNTMNLILDPNEIKRWAKRRFIWVKTKISIQELEQIPWYFDLYWLDNTGNKMKEVEIYHHYTRYDWKVYLTSWLWDCSRLIRVVEIDAKWSFADTFWFSLFIPWNIWNGQVADIIELGVEYQMMMSQITNLMLIQAKKDVLWEDRLVNINKVDFEFLKMWSPGGRNIPVELEEWEALNNVLFQIPKEQGSQRPAEWINILEKLKQEATWVTPITQGLPTWQNMTKWEVQILQANANGKFSLIMGALIRSDKEFWMTWQSFYSLYFNGEKTIVLDYKHKSEYHLITRKDLWNNYLVWAVRVEATSEINKKKDEKFQKMIAVMPNVMPYMWKDEQIYFLRNVLELSWLEREEIEQYLPETLDEMKAKLELERLNLWQKASEPEIWENQLVFERVLKWWIPTGELAKAIALRRMLRMEEMKQQAEWMWQMQAWMEAMQDWQEQGAWQTANNFKNMANISQAQTMSQILNSKWVISNNDVM